MEEKGGQSGGESGGLNGSRKWERAFERDISDQKLIDQNIKQKNISLFIFAEKPWLLCVRDKTVG